MSLRLKITPLIIAVFWMSNLWCTVLFVDWSWLIGLTLTRAFFDLCDLFDVCCGTVHTSSFLVANVFVLKNNNTK